MVRNLSYPGTLTLSAGDAPAAAPEPEKTESQPHPTAEPAAPGELKTALLKAVEERARRAEGSVLRSMAEQNNMPETELVQMLREARAEQALPPEAQKRLDAATESANRRLLLAEVKNVGAEMGLVDADVALSLIDPAAVSVLENGTVSGVREALEGIKRRKGYLFAARSAWAQRVSSGGTAQASGVEEAFYRKNPALRRQA